MLKIDLGQNPRTISVDATNVQKQSTIWRIAQQLLDKFTLGDLGDRSMQLRQRCAPPNWLQRALRIADEKR